MLRLPLALAVATCLATAPAQTHAFTTNSGLGSVTVTDTATRTVLGTIPVGTAPVDVAVAPDGRRAYVANFTSGTVSVIDTATRSLVATIPVGSYPSGVGTALDGSRIYVVRDYNGVVLVLDATTFAVLRTIPVPSTNGGFGSVTVSPDGSRVYLTAGSVTVLDGATDQVVATFGAGACANLALTPDGSRVYCVDSWFGSLYGFDTATHTLTSTTTIAGLPSSIAITRDGRKAFVAVPAYLAMSNGVGAPAPTRLVQVVDLTTHQVVQSLTTAQPPGGIAVTVDGTRVCVALPLAGQILELDPTTHQPITSYAAGARPSAMAMAPVPASAVAYGAPCTPPTGVVTLAAATLPWSGTTFRATAAGAAPLALLLGVVGFAAQSVPLANLLPAGVTGCELLATGDALVPLANGGGAADLTIVLPPTPAFAGLVLHEQVLQFDGVQLSGSNGLRAVVGLR